MSYLCIVVLLLGRGGEQEMSVPRVVVFALAPVIVLGVLGAVAVTAAAAVAVAVLVVAVRKAVQIPAGRQ